ncbi:hypothetical protein CR513_34113, partial [Mucuna pruriens]
MSLETPYFDDDLVDRMNNVNGQSQIFFEAKLFDFFILLSLVVAVLANILNKCIFIGFSDNEFDFMLRRNLSKVVKRFKQGYIKESHTWSNQCTMYNLWSIWRTMHPDIEQRDQQPLMIVQLSKKHRASYLKVTWFIQDWLALSATFIVLNN